MKLRTILPLLLLTFTLFAPQGTARAQTNKDWVTITTDKFQTTGWRIAFHHFLPNQPGVSTLTLVLDTNAFLNVRLDPNGQGLQGPADSQYQWNPFTNNTDTYNYNDSEGWCNSFNAILPNQSDSFFVFGLQPNPNNQNAQINDSAVTICWYASFESNDCKNHSPISSGCFQVIPTIFQSNPPFDTMTATTPTSPCDPVFNFTVHNRNGLQQAIGKVTIELLDIFNATMRPSDVSAPPGWKLDSVTQFTANFTAVEPIAPGASQSNFIVGLRTDPSSTTFDFVLHANDYLGNIIDRDTSLGIPATAQPCSENTTSDDTLRISNNQNCAFNFNLENSHVGNVDVSPIDKFVAQIITHNVIFSNASPPIQGGKNWSVIGIGTPTLSWQTPTESSAQPSGLTWTYPASIDDPTPGELVTVNWIDSNGTTETSRGTDTFRCKAPPTPDSVFVDALGSCGYRVRVKNVHTNPTSSIHAVLFEMPGIAGSFSPSGLSSNANWGYSFGSGDTSLQFTAGTLLAPSATDTFFFSTNPKQPNTTWSMTFIDYEAGSGNTITNMTINNIAGCTPPVVLDSVIHHMDNADCFDTIRIVNRGTDPIDSIEIVPANGVSVDSATHATPWSKPILAGDSAILLGGTIPPQSPLTFIVGYAGESQNTPFNVEVRTLHTSGPTSANDAMLSCAVSGVSPQSTTAPLTLSIAPNPLRDQTDIMLTTGTTDRVRMVLLNVLGQTEQTVVDQTLGAGAHKFTLDASTLPAGTYYLRLETNGQVMTKKLVIEK